MTGWIFDIKHFAVHDGEGIRTTVFFKGCPLRCVWCHNPEGLTSKKQLSFFSVKCIVCGTCIKACPAAAISSPGQINRTICTNCGRCADVCPASALAEQGYSVTEDELFIKVTEEKDFYDDGGGVTFSGGECLLQAEFCAKMLKRLKKAGINTAVDTCGMVEQKAFEAVLPFTDTFLYDLKAIDPEVHKRCTGADNALILNNLTYLNNVGANLEVVIPLVKGYNLDEWKNILVFLKSLDRVKTVKLLKYHGFYFSKYEALGLKAPPADMSAPTKKEFNDIKKSFIAEGFIVKT